MNLVVGLGNPGEKYKNTRHNTGFIILDEIVSKKGLTYKREKKSLVAKDNNDIYCKPQTFMNDSGEAVLALVNYYDIEPQNITIIHDDVDLPLGEFKKQFGRGSAGHKGVYDIFELLGTDGVWRVRVGVGKSLDPKIETDVWVLQNFSDEELKVIKSLEIDPEPQGYPAEYMYSNPR